VEEPPLPCVLDDRDVDLLLQKLRAVHGEARPDIAPELLAALAARKERASRRREVSTAEAAAWYFIGSPLAFLRTCLTSRFEASQDAPNPPLGASHMLPSRRAATFPDLARPINGIVRRLSDLLPVVRGGLYHPGFEFSKSIKNVAPALCPDVTYDEDEIADGTSASTAFCLMASGRVDAKTSARLRRLLCVYCHRDTWAMVRLHQGLKILAAGS
jgi:hypothetical protein